MLEVNNEIYEEIKLFLEMVGKISNSELKIEIPLSILSPSIYMSSERSTIEEWGNTILSEIFSSTIISERFEVISGANNVKDLLIEKDRGEYDFHLDIIEDYLVNYEDVGNGDLLDRSRFFEMYFDSMEIGKITFKSSLFTDEISEDKDIKLLVPFLIMDKYDLRYESFISAEIDEGLNFTVWYLFSGRDDFLEYLPNNITREDIYKFFTKMIVKE